MSGIRMEKGKMLDGGEGMSPASVLGHREGGKKKSH